MDARVRINKVVKCRRSSLERMFLFFFSTNAFLRMNVDIFTLFCAVWAFYPHTAHLKQLLENSFQVKNSTLPFACKQESGVFCAGPFCLMLSFCVFSCILYLLKPNRASLTLSSRIFFHVSRLMYIYSATTQRTRGASFSPHI